VDLAREVLRLLDRDRPRVDEDLDALDAGDGLPDAAHSDRAGQDRVAGRRVDARVRGALGQRRRGRQREKDECGQRGAGPHPDPRSVDETSLACATIRCVALPSG
jgi:hypothetical protein